MADYIYTMESRLTPDQMKGVNLVQESARQQNFNLYLTGGAIRDILTGFPIRDLDFTVQGNPFKLQKDLERHGARVDGIEEELKVLHLILPGNVRAEISMARAETYSDKPGKPPAVAPATINEDLRRRDFTINSMALSLNEGSRGLLLDPFNGAADIESKLIRILHNYAFLEDPSRLIRAVRFCTRFQWELEDRTKARYESAKENDYMQYIRREQCGYELEQLAHEDDPIAIAKALEKEGWLKVLHQHLAVAKFDVQSLQQLMKTRQVMLDLGISVDAAPAVMHFITSKMPEKDCAEIQKLMPRKEFVAAWKHLEDGAKDLAKRLQGKEAATNSSTWKLLTEAKPEAILFLEVTGKQKVATDKIRNYFGKWRELMQRLPFPEMAEMRITPQLPEYPKIAHEAFLLMLDGKLRSHNEIVKFLEPHSPPPPPPPPPAPTRRGRKADATAKKSVAAAAPSHAQSAPAVSGEAPKATEGASAAKKVASKAAGAALNRNAQSEQVKVPAKGASNEPGARHAAQERPAALSKATTKAPAKAVHPVKQPAKAAHAAPAKKSGAKSAAPAKKVAPAKKAAPAAKKAAKKATPAKKAAKKGR